MWETIRRPKRSIFSYFRRSRHRQINPIKLPPPTLRKSYNQNDTNEESMISELPDSISQTSSLESDKLALMQAYLSFSRDINTLRPDGSVTCVPEKEVDSSSWASSKQSHVSTPKVPIKVQRSKTIACCRSRPDLLLDEICDSVSIYSEIFLPDHWLYMGEEEKFLDGCWRTGSRLQMAKVKNKVKAWLLNETNTFPMK